MVKPISEGAAAAAVGCITFAPSSESDNLGNDDVGTSSNKARVHKQRRGRERRFVVVFVVVMLMLIWMVWRMPVMDRSVRHASTIPSEVMVIVMTFSDSS